MDKQINASSVTVSSKIRIRGIGGYITDDYFSISDFDNVTIDIYQNTLKFILKSSSYINVTNNTPVSINLHNLSIAFD